MTVSPSTSLRRPRAPWRWLISAVCAVASPLAATATSPVGDSRQLMVVTTSGWNDDHGRLRTFERVDGHWQPAGPAIAVSIGRRGSAWGLGLHPDSGQGPRKREGDGRSPAGIFDLGITFGAEATADTAMPYRAMTRSDYCIDMPDSAIYGQIVDARDVGDEAVAGSTEPMRLDLHRNGDPRYQLGFVIAHNPGHQPGQGSCIFGHLRRHPKEVTAGCTAMAPADMQALLGWLDPEAHPRFVLLPEAEYRARYRQWDLPSPESAQP